MMYYQLNIDYIIETYCVNKDKPELKCNGKCHLAKQLQVVNSKQDKSNSKTDLLFEAFYPVYFVNTQNLISKQTFMPILNENNWHLKYLKDTEILSSLFRPPKPLS